MTCFFPLEIPLEKTSYDPAFWQSLKTSIEKQLSPINSFFLPDELAASLSLAQYQYFARNFDLAPLKKLNIVDNLITKKGTLFIYDSTFAMFPNVFRSDESVPLKTFLKDPYAYLRFKHWVYACLDLLPAFELSFLARNFDIQMSFYHSEPFSVFRFWLLSIPFLLQSPVYYDRPLRSFFNNLNKIEHLSKKESSYAKILFKLNCLKKYVYAHSNDPSDLLYHFLAAILNKSITLCSYEEIETIIALFIAKQYKNNPHSNNLGLHIAIALFHPNWFNLYDPIKRQTTKELARICLALLEADKLHQKAIGTWYDFKAYFSLYSQPITCLEAITKEKFKNEQTLGYYASHIAHILWSLNEEEMALAYLHYEDIKQVEEPEQLHLIATTAAVLGNFSLSEKALLKLSHLCPDYFKDGYQNAHKWFDHALALKAIGFPSYKEFLSSSEYFDALFEKKSFLLSRVRTHQSVPQNLQERFEKSFLIV